MKRIVNGVTYNTDTATKIARSEWAPDDGPTVGILYQTRGGAFFVHRRIQKEQWNELSHEAEQTTVDVFDPMSAERAHAWILEGEVEVFHNPFDDPPEAAAEAEPGATIYIRVPASLKRRVDEAAADEKVSGNVWAMRCVERCVDGFPQDVARIWHIARGLTAHWLHETDEQKQHVKKLDAYKLAKATEALEEIAQLVERFAKERFGTDDLSKISGTEPYDLRELGKRFQPYPDGA
jgi:hypothetical protein